MELSEVLKENREKTHGIVAGAEELAVSPHSFSLGEPQVASLITYVSVS